MKRGHDIPGRRPVGRRIRSAAYGHVRFFSRAAAACLILLLLMPACAVSGAEPDRPGDTVRMGFFEFGGMFSGAADGTEKSGYCYEYMMQVSTYAGWNYTFRYGTYAELYELLKAGEIDILPYTNYNGQRGQEVLFSDRTLADEEYYIAVRSGDYAAPEDLNGRVISTLEGADYNGLLTEYIAEHGLDLRIRYYPGFDETWDAVERGDADATVFTSNAYSNDGWHCIDRFGRKPTYIAVAKGREDLLERLNEASGMIEIDNPAFQGQLYAQYFSDNPMRRSLSPDEQDWVARHPVLHVGGFTNDAPYFRTVGYESGGAEGLTADVVNGIIERLGLGITADFRGFDTLEDMEAALKNGEIDLIIPFYPDYNIAQRDGLIISNTVRVSNMELVYPKGLSYAEALERVATPATRLGIYYVEDTFPESRIIGAVSVQDAVDRVRGGEATGAIAQNVVLHNVKEKYDDLNYTVLSEGCGTCFAARPEDYLLIRILNRGMNYFSAAEIASVASLYTLEPNVTTLAYLASHKEAVVMLAVILAAFVTLLIMLLQVYRLKKKADAASRAKTTFLFNMSHDIRTPMNAVLGFTDKAIRHENEPHILDESLRKAKASGEYLLKIINDILDMARIESGKLELKEELRCAEENCRTLVDVFGEDAAKKDIRLHTSFSAKDRYLWLDEGRNSQIVANLVSNAVKYTPPGGEIWFTVEQIPCDRAGYARYTVTVKDTGCGMSREFLDRIFESFERDTSAIRSGAQGTGLGMAIVRRLIDAMNGTISVQSEPGKGTTVSYTVDYRIADESEIAAYRAKNGRTEDSAEERLAGKRILVVEDNPLNLEIAVDLLEDRGLITETAEDGSAAVEKLKTLAERKDYDYYAAVLMDVQMPVMNGYEATRAIRAIPVPDGVHLPIIAMTANAFEEDRRNAADAGMDGHIAKPVNAQKLFDTLTRFI